MTHLLGLIQPKRITNFLLINNINIELYTKIDNFEKNYKIDQFFQLNIAKYTLKCIKV